jgi:hypothetical protein
MNTDGQELEPGYYKLISNVIMKESSIGGKESIGQPKDSFFALEQ